MGRTKIELISDIEERITRAKPSDDLEISHSLINHWLDTTANYVISSHLNKLLKQNKSIPPFYIRQSLENSVKKESSSYLTEEAKRYYVDITDLDVMELEKDGGIVRASTGSGKLIKPVTEKDLHWIRGLWFSKPSRENMMFYRENQGNYMFIVGMTDNLYKMSKINIFYVKSVDTSSLDNDSEYPISGDLVDLLLDATEVKAMKVLAGEHEDFANDGSQE